MNELVDGPEIEAAHDWVVASIRVDSKTTLRVVDDATRPHLRSGRGNEALPPRIPLNQIQRTLYPAHKKSETGP
jgi:hypothetical protein